jgi:hypothetical protein
VLNLSTRVLSSLTGANPRGTVCALVGLLAVLAHYRRVWRAKQLGSPRQASASDYPANDSRFWTSRPYVLIGMLLSVATLALSGAVDGSAGEWGLRVLATLALTAAWATLTVGCIFLARHWKEVVTDFRTPVHDDLFHQLTEKPDDSGRYEMAPHRLSLLTKSLLLACGLALAVEAAKRFGIAPERLLENPLLADIYDHVIWAFITTFLVLLWTTRSRLALVLRTGVLLVFSLIIVITAGFLLVWLASQNGPALVTLLAIMIWLNFVFFSRIERAARDGGIETTR